MKTLKYASSMALLLAFGFAGASSVSGSSHAEAPAIGDDPTLDNTDVWAWKDSASSIVILTAWNGIATPAGGPNYRRWTAKEQGIYEIHIDTTGDGVEDVTYQFQFSNVIQTPSQTFLRVTSPAIGYGGLSAPGDAGQTFRQTYSVTRLNGSRRNPSSASLQAAPGTPVAPPNTGPKLTKGRLNGRYPVVGTEGYNQGSITAPSAGNNYESLADAAIFNTAEGGQVFVGPRQDAFYVDLGPAFDQLTVRTLLSPVPGGSTLGGVNVGQYGGGFNTISGKNVEVIALRVPIATLGAGFSTTALNGGNSVGVWSSASRTKVRVGGVRPGITTGQYVQVSRLGNPLVNELFIPHDDKDTWNAREPRYDGDPIANGGFREYFTGENGRVVEPALVINALYAGALGGGAIPFMNRTDMVGIFAPDTLKVRMDAGAPALGPNDLAFARLGAAANQSAQQVSAAPNGLLFGRTLRDDVVDIYLQVAAGKLLGGAFATNLNNVLGDGVDWGTNGDGAGIRTRNSFPFMGPPIDGQEIKNDWAQSPITAR